MSLGLSLHESFFFWCALFFRLGTFFYFAPITGEQPFPKLIRLGLALTLSYLIWLHTPLPTQMPPSFSLLLMKEFALGFLSAFWLKASLSLLSSCFNAGAASLGWQYAPFLTGETQSSSNGWGILFHSILIQVVLLSNGHHLILQSLLTSWQKDPWLEKTLFQSAAFLKLFQGIFLESFKIAWPFFFLQLISAFLFSLLSRLFSRIQIFHLTFPFNLGASLLLLILTASSLIRFAQNHLLPQTLHAFSTILKIGP